MDLNSQELHKDKVHRILAHSYSFYFFMFLLGVSLDSIFPLKILNNRITIPAGLLLLLLATVLIFWAQKTSRNLKKENLNKEMFSKGPYAITRSPTHWGLFMLMLGFGFTINAIFLVISSLLSLLVTRLVFLRKEEIILEKKYGAPYLEYKKTVKF